MPSTLPGSQSGGQPLVSGNPWSGSIVPAGEVKLKVSESVSGIVYVGVALGLTSAGIVFPAGGAFSSGGLSDGMELAAGDEYSIPKLQCSGQIDRIRLLVASGLSGTMRVFWDVR